MVQPSEAEIQQQMAVAEAKAKLVAKRIKHWTLEKRYGDNEYLARNEFTEELPALNQIWRLYLLTWRKDGRPLVVRQDGADQLWTIPTVEQELDTSEDAGKPATKKQMGAWLKPMAKERWGITIKNWYQAARLHLTATTHAVDVKPGSERFFLFLCANASKLDDIPADAGWARRAIETKDFVSLVREQYYEFDEILDQVHNGYLVKQAQA